MRRDDLNVTRRTLVISMEGGTPEEVDIDRGGWIA